VWSLAECAVAAGRTSRSTACLLTLHPLTDFYSAEKLRVLL
jgi:hypothetical protein